MADQSNVQITPERFMELVKTASEEDLRPRVRATFMPDAAEAVNRFPLSLS